jgi:hypothetical protein
MTEFNYKDWFDEIENALTIHSHDLDKKIYEAPNIHNKILKQFIKEKQRLIKAEQKYNKTLAEKFHYYRYESDIRCENKDVTLFYVKKDKDFLKVAEDYEKQKLLCEMIDGYMKKARSIGFDIKNILEYLRYMDGQ